MRQNDLGSVNPALLNDESVGFYNNVISSHNKLSKKYAKDEAISSGFEDRQKAVEEFRDDKDFESLLGKIKITANEDGEGYNRAEALDETFEIDLNRYQSNAVVYYLKAKNAEDMGDMEKREYFMRLFKKQVEKLGVKISKIGPKKYLVYGKGLGSFHIKKNSILNCFKLL